MTEYGGQVKANGVYTGGIFVAGQDTGERGAECLHPSAEGIEYRENLHPPCEEVKRLPQKSVPFRFGLQFTRRNLMPVFVAAELSRRESQPTLPMTTPRILTDQGMAG